MRTALVNALTKMRLQPSERLKSYPRPLKLVLRFANSDSQIKNDAQ